MKALFKHILWLLFLNLVIISAGYFIISVTKVDLIFTEIIILSAFFSIIALIAIIIFQKGQSKEPDSQTMHSLVSTGVKFLLELALALVWFFVYKKTSVQSLLMFFVLYLAFSLYLITFVLKTLKNKSL